MFVTRFCLELCSLSHKHRSNSSADRTLLHSCSAAATSFIWIEMYVEGGAQRFRKRRKYAMDGEMDCVL